MAWGVFKKIKNAVKKAANWVGKTVKKVVNSPITKKVIDTGMKLAPVIGAGISSAAGGSPSAGMQVGHVVQGIGNSLGFG